MVDNTSFCSKIGLMNYLAPVKDLSMHMILVLTIKVLKSEKKIMCRGLDFIFNAYMLVKKSLYTHRKPCLTQLQKKTKKNIPLINIQ